MDPQQCWNDLLDALKRKDWDHAKNLADSLHEWLCKRGFPPITVGDESLGVEWHRTIAAFICLHVANKVDDIRKRRKQRNSPQKKGRECCCTAFELGDYVFANDSTSPDGAQEYGVLKRTTDPTNCIQIESITFGWCDHDECLRHIQRTFAGEYDKSPFVHAVKVILQSPEEHGRCGHCA